MKIPETKAAVNKEREKLEKMPAWILEKMKSKKDVFFWKHKKRGKVNYAALVAICHLKNAEPEPKFQKKKGRVVLRGDIVKDDSGADALNRARPCLKWLLQK